MAHGSKTTSKAIPPLTDAMFVASDAQSGTVNRKKQKRRQKQAAKLATQEPSSRPHGTSPIPSLSNGPTTAPMATGQYPSQGRTASSTTGQRGSLDLDDEDYDTEEDDDATLPYNAASGQYSNGQPIDAADVGGKKKSRKKKKSKASQPGPDSHVHESYANHGAMVHGHPNRPGNKDRIWNTSTQEERERIKEFWQSLGEEDRKSLVKIEKEAVLKKMKEQQKHSCSCSLCGRKRNAIEEELEILYDAYYDELEQYAYEVGPADAGQIAHYGTGLREPPRLHPQRTPVPLPGPHGQMREPSDYDEDEEADDEDAEYSDDYDEEDEYSQDSDSVRDVANDFLQLGNSLTVKGPLSKGFPIYPMFKLTY
jgi:hypothetical protein